MGVICRKAGDDCRIGQSELTQIHARQRRVINVSLRLCRACQQWHSLDSAWPSACVSHFRARSARSDLPAPKVISDYLEAHSPISGEMFTSKADLRRHYRHNGVIEVGNDKVTPRDNDDRPIAEIEADVAQAFTALGA